MFPFVLVALIFFGCSEEVIEPVFDAPINQNLHGKIDGVTWKYDNGYLITQATGDTNFKHIHQLLFVDTLQTDQCNPVWGKRSILIIDIYNDNVALAVKKYDSPNTTPYLIKVSLQYYHHRTGPLLEYVDLTGYLEVISRDYAHETITGQVDFKKNGSNYIIGSFTVPYCD